jgi:predicted dehydrogenase
MTSKPKRVGMAVVGSSGHAARVAVPAILRSGDASLVGVLGSTAERSKSLAAEHEGCAAYRVTDELFADRAVDAVWIASPNQTHVDYARACLEAGRHVLVEKPLATTSDDARAVQATAEERGLTVKVGLQHRFRPPHTWLRNELEHARLGRLSLLRIHRCWPYPYFPEMPADPSSTWRLSPEASGGWALNDIGSHLVDIALWLAGEPAVLVHAETANFSFVDVPVEDTAILLLRTASGAILTIETSNAFGSYPGTIEVHGTKGWLRADGTFDGGGIVLDDHGDRMTFPQVTPDQVHDAMLADFVAAVRGEPSRGATAADGAANVALIEQATAQHRSEVA